MVGQADVGAVEADLVAHVAMLHRPPNGEVHEEADSVWFATGDDDVHANGILRASLPERDVEAAVDRLLRPFRERQLPMMWWFFTSIDGLRPDVEEALRWAGLALESDLPGMTLDLEGFVAPAQPLGLSNERVGDPETFAAWASVVARAFEDPDFAGGRSVRAFGSFGFADDAPFRHYVCSLDDEPVGASTLSLAGGVGGLANIAAVPEHRGRGIGRSAAAAALTDAVDLGLEVAALSADSLGLPLYERLGFRTVGRHLTYVGRP